MTVCDCNKPNTRGLLDLTDPAFCGTNHADYPKYYNKPAKYRIMTKQTYHLELEGLTCSEWVQTKRITGSFWYGSFDTEHFHTSRAVTQEECRNMKASKTCAGNKMIQNNKAYSFIQEPVGEGSWNSIKEYSVVNCVAHEITLRQEEPDGLLISPFGYHNVSITTGHFQFNHNTIVWNIPKEKKTTNCGTDSVVSGFGKLSLTKVGHELVYRMLDTDRQMEILFHPEESKICDTLQNLYKVIGIPNTYIWLSLPITKYFPKPNIPARKKRSIANAISEKASQILLNTNNTSITNNTSTLERIVKFVADSDHIVHEGFIYSWGKIKLNDQNILTSGEVGGELFLAPPVTEGLSQSINQEFEYTTSRTIRISKSQLCISADKSPVLLIKPCNQTNTRWIIDNTQKKIVEMDKSLCLTAVGKTVGLNYCYNTTYQTWQIENENNNTKFRSLNPIPTIEDFQFTEQELRSRETQIIQDINKVYFWGKLTNKRSKSSQTCLTTTEGTSKLEMKPCIVNDTTQDFEYTKDFTIRKFGTNECLEVTILSANLKPCVNESLRFGRNEQTGQIIELETQLCLQHTQNAKMVHLGECGEEQTLRRQKWKFQYYNPEKENSLEPAYLTNEKIIDIHIFRRLRVPYYVDIPPIMDRTTIPEIPTEDFDAPDFTPTPTSSKEPDTTSTSTTTPTPPLPVRPAQKSHCSVTTFTTTTTATIFVPTIEIKTIIPSAITITTPTTITFVSTTTFTSVSTLVPPTTTETVTETVTPSTITEISTSIVTPETITTEITLDPTTITDYIISTLDPTTIISISVSTITPETITEKITIGPETITHSTIINHPPVTYTTNYTIEAKTITEIITSTLPLETITITLPINQDDITPTITTENTKGITPTVHNTISPSIISSIQSTKEEIPQVMEEELGYEYGDYEFPQAGNLLEADSQIKEWKRETTNAEIPETQEGSRIEAVPREKQQISTESQIGQTGLPPAEEEAAINQIEQDNNKPKDTSPKPEGEADETAKEIKHLRNESEEAKATTIDNLDDRVKNLVNSLHGQFKHRMTTDHENTLAEETRQIYCQLSVMRKVQAITLSQTNGILAAVALQLPECSRLQGLGQSLLLQECTKQRLNITAIETSCGFQPFTIYNGINYTIGTDGWSLHPYSPCFWKTHLVNLNGKTHHWVHTTQKNDWVELKPNIHTSNIKLISQFDEIHLKDYDFNIHSHPAHKISDLEQLNVLNDLIGRIQDASSNSISNLVMNTKKESKIINLFSWTKTLKIVVSVIVGIALLLISIKLLTLFHPIPKLLSSFRNLFTTRRLQRDRQEAPIEMTTPMITMPSNSSTPNPTPMTMSPDTEPVHSHNKCTFVVGRGLVWEDLCPCDPTNL